MISLWVVLWSNEAFALERAALALSGPDCRLSHQAILETLERLEESHGWRRRRFPIISWSTTMVCIAQENSWLAS